jgi:hypothetical protein
MCGSPLFKAARGTNVQHVLSGVACRALQSRVGQCASALIPPHSAALVCASLATPSSHGCRRRRRRRRRFNRPAAISTRPPVAAAASCILTLPPPAQATPACVPAQPALTHRPATTNTAATAPCVRGCRRAPELAPRRPGAGSTAYAHCGGDAIGLLRTRALAMAHGGLGVDQHTIELHLKVTCHPRVRDRFALHLRHPPPAISHSATSHGRPDRRLLPACARRPDASIWPARAYLVAELLRQRRGERVVVPAAPQACVNRSQLLVGCRRSLGMQRGWRKTYTRRNTDLL